MQDLCLQTQKNQIIFKGFSDGALQAMRSYKWPGNVRELKNLVESMIVLVLRNEL